MSARVVLGLLFVLASPKAAPADAVAVPLGYRQVAAEYGIPPAIFYAIALAESGRVLDASPALHPWPWTLNIRGQAHFFDRRGAAERALAAALAEGEDVVDVGLMQVNWRYHRARLKEPRAALDPYRNLRAAAAILQGCHQSRQDWWSAVGCYHAPADPARALAYRARVADHWRRLKTAQ